MRILGRIVRPCKVVCRNIEEGDPDGFVSRFRRFKPLFCRH